MGADSRVPITRQPSVNINSQVIIATDPALSIH